MSISSSFLCTISRFRYRSIVSAFSTSITLLKPITLSPYIEFVGSKFKTSLTNFPTTSSLQLVLNNACLRSSSDDDYSVKIVLTLLTTVPDLSYEDLALSEESESQNVSSSFTGTCVIIFRSYKGKTVDYASGRWRLSSGALGLPFS